MVFKANLVKELQNTFSKTSNGKESSNFTYYSYFFVLFESIAIYAIKRNRRYQKDCWHWEKKVKRIENIAKYFIPISQKKVFHCLFYENWTKQLCKTGRYSIFYAKFE